VDKVPTGRRIAANHADAMRGFKYIFRKKLGRLLIITRLFLSLHRAFWYSHSSFTNRCTFIRLQFTL